MCPKKAHNETVEPKTKAISNFEDVLEIVDGWGKYQIIILGFLLVECIILAYVQYGPVLFLFIPEHRCSVDHILQFWHGTEADLIEKVIPSVDQGGDVGVQRSKCLIYGINWNYDKTGFLINTNITEPCGRDTGYWYATEEYFHSAATDVSLKTKSQNYIRAFGFHLPDELGVRRKLERGIHSVLVFCRRCDW